MSHQPSVVLDDQRERIQHALGDGFTLGRLLGRGGHAEVYAATDERLKRQVAIKLLRAELAEGGSLAARFVREAKTVANLRHPNIIPIYQVGETDGLAFFVMPLIEGETLLSYIARTGPLAVEEARRILREVSEALAYAHKADVVHRDIKPDNIMLEGAERRAIVTDFGIAKALQPDETALTETGVAIGTPRYMSPEQASGESIVDHRSDVYSLGVVAYEMLTGRRPFESASARELIMHHIATQPADPRMIRRELPADLSATVLKCLRKDPAERWTDAAELATALGANGMAATGRESRVPFLAVALLCAAALMWSLAAGRAQTPLWQLPILVAPLVMAVQGWRRGGARGPQRERRPFEMPTSFESGLYGGLVGGAIGGTFIAALYAANVLATGYAAASWLIAQIVLFTILASAVLGAGILVGVSWQRSLIDTEGTARQVTADFCGATLGGMIAGSAVGILVSVVFAMRPLPPLPAAVLFPGVAVIGVATVLGTLRHEYRRRLRQLVLPFIGAVVVTTFAVVLTVAFFPYEAVVNTFWIEHAGRTLTPARVSAGGIIIGAVVGAMLGIQAGGTMAIHRILRSAVSRENHSVA